MNEATALLGRCVNAVEWKTTLSNAADAHCERNRDVVASQRVQEVSVKAHSTYKGACTAISCVSWAQQQSYRGVVEGLTALLQLAHEQKRQIISATEQKK